MLPQSKRNLGKKGLTNNPFCAIIKSEKRKGESQMEFEMELYNRYLAGCDEDEEVLSFEDWLVWSSEEAEDFEDYDLEVGFDPYCGCYTWDC